MSQSGIARNSGVADFEERPGRVSTRIVNGHHPRLRQHRSTPPGTIACA